MKKYFLLVVFILFNLCLFAQMPGASPTIGRIYGKLVDSVGKGIGDASVVLLQNRMDTVNKKMKELPVTNH
jgi:hypothetical protein